MKRMTVRRILCLLLAVLSVLALPAAALEEVSAAEAVADETAAEQTVDDPFGLTEGDEAVQALPDEAADPAQTEELPIQPEPAVYVNGDGSYLAPETLSVYIMRRMGDEELSDPKQAEEKYTGVAAFYDYNETNEKTRLEHPYFFYYVKGELQAEQPEFVSAKGYLDLTQAPAEDGTINPAADDAHKLVYVAEEVYVDADADEHPAYLFAFNRSGADNGLFTGEYEDAAYVGGLAAEAEEEPVQAVAAVRPAKAPAAAGITAFDAEQPTEEAETEEAETEPVPQTVPTPVATTVLGGVRVSWGADAYATGFRVYRKAVGGSWTTLANLDSGEATDYLDETASSGTGYYYTVRAYYGDVERIATNNAYGSGDWSDYRLSGLLYYLEAPQVTLSGSESKITVTWSAVTGADRYHIYRAAVGDKGWTWLATVKSGSALSYTDKSAESGVHYYYIVKANNIANNASSAYDSADNRTDTSKTVVFHAAPIVSAGTVASGVQVSWGKDVDATGYRVYRKVPGGGWVTLTTMTTGDTTGYLDENVSSGTTYYYAVRAFYGDTDRMGTTSYSSSDWSGYNTASLIYMDTPAFGDIYSDKGFMNVQWTAVPGATGYSVYRRTASDSGWTWLSFASGTSYQDKTVTNGTAYYYAVKAYATDAKGVKNSGVSTKTQTAYIYHAPMETTVSVTASGYLVTWNTDPKATGYRVFRNSDSTTRVVSNIRADSLPAGASTAQYADASANLQEGKTYYYTVRAYYGSSDIGSAAINTKNDWNGYQWSKVVYLATPKMQITADNVANGIKVRWEAVTGAEGYYIYRRTGSGDWKKLGSISSGTANAYIDTTATKLAANTECYYTVRAYADKGGSMSYYDRTGSYSIYLPKPATVKVELPTSAGTKITWSAVSGAQSYRIYRRPNNSSSWSLLTAVTGTAYVDTDAKSSDSFYFYMVRPCASGTVNGRSVTVMGSFDTVGYSHSISWSGKERQAWVKKNGNTYYVDKNGFCVTGWQYLTRNGAKYKYYFDPRTGALVTNLYSYFGKEYRSMQCRIVTYINTTSSSNPSFTTIYLYDQATDSYCIPAVSVRCVGSPIYTRTTNSGYLERGSGTRWASHMEGLQYATRIHGSASYFHSILYRRDSNTTLNYGTYNSLADNRNNTNGCIRLQCIYAYLIQDIMHNGYGANHRVRVMIRMNSAQPGPFGAPKIDKISKRNTDPTDPAVSGLFFYDTTSSGVTAKAGAPEWTYY